MHHRLLVLTRTFVERAWGAHVLYVLGRFMNAPMRMPVLFTLKMLMLNIDFLIPSYSKPYIWLP